MFVASESRSLGGGGGALHLLHSLTCNQLHTQCNTHSDPSQIAEYCLAFIALPVMTTLRNQFFVLSSIYRQSHVVWPCCLFLDLLPILDFSLVLSFGFCLYLAWIIICLLDYPFASPFGFVHHRLTHTCLTDYSIVFVFAIV